MVVTSPLLSFDSQAFADVPGEDEPTSPRVSGRRFAEWISARMKERGLPARDAYAEDWGWCVELDNHKHVGSSRVDLQACKLEYSIVSPK